jgi:hypothetical protein
VDDTDRRRDGNAAAGPLAEIFGREMTTAHAVCDGCGADTPVGSLIAYDPGLGIILRCPECDAVMIRISRVRGGYWLDLRGASVLRIQSEG